MKTFILQSNKESDLMLLLQLAERLGIRFFEAPNDLDLEEIVSTNTLDKSDFLSNVPNSSALYEGLNLPSEPTFYKLEEMPAVYEKSVPKNYSAKGLSKALDEVGGAWEDDKDETLEDLLNMLTP